jgi:hypothetical protein
MVCLEVRVLLYHFPHIYGVIKLILGDIMVTTLNDVDVISELIHDLLYNYNHVSWVDSDYDGENLNIKIHIPLEE